MTIPFNLGGDNNDIAQAVVALSNGKILVAGGVDTGTTPTDSSLGESAVVVRLNADGSLDTTFGEGGKVILPSPDPRRRLDKITAMTVQPDGDIVVVGTALRSVAPSAGSVGSFVDPGQDFSVARLNADGSLDTSFGTGGQLMIGFDIGGDNNDTANGVAAHSPMARSWFSAPPRVGLTAPWPRWLASMPTARSTPALRAAAGSL